LKIQHALRAFTAQDRKMIKLTAENYPLSEFYKTDELLTSLGIGEAVITVLNEKGIPTPLAATLLCAPKSRMDILTEEELNAVIAKSKLIAKYNEQIDRESAYEILNAKIQRAQQTESEISREVPQVKFPEQQRTTTSRRTEKSTAEKIASSPLAKQVGRTLVREIARGIFGVLGLGGRRK
jgi:hypothetical protein